MSEATVPRITYVDDQEQVVELTDDETAYVLANDPQIRREWTRRVGMSGQARLPMSERRGSLVIVEPERVKRLLSARQQGNADGT
jgi:hypothetical protein